MLIHDLVEKKLISPPKFLPDNTHYMCITGSTAYGVSEDDSDHDIYGFCMPPREQIFPHLSGEIPDFGQQKQRFKQWSEHHIQDGDQEYDFTIYGIVKFFQLCMENNPNMCDALFVPSNCVIHVTRIGQMVLNSRDEFLHKGSYHKFRGYAYAQLAKLRDQNPSNPKRKASVDRFGFDNKKAYHLVRLSLEAEYILRNHTLMLGENAELLREVRAGQWSLYDIEKWFADKEKVLEDLYRTSTLRSHPDQYKIKELLFDCIETHYGKISQKVVRDTSNILNDFEALIAQYRSESYDK